MKAKKVIYFEEDIDPYKALKIGQYKPLELNDELEIQESFFYDHDSSEYKKIKGSNTYKKGHHIEYLKGWLYYVVENMGYDGIVRKMLESGVGQGCDERDCMQLDMHEEVLHFFYI